MKIHLQQIQSPNPYLAFLFLILSVSLKAQNIGIGTLVPDGSAALDVSSTDKGLLIPRMSTSDRQNILEPATGLMVYDSTNKAFYYFTGNGWLELLAGSVDKILDADGDTKIEVEQSPDQDVMHFTVGGAGAGNIRKNAAGIPLFWFASGNGSLILGEHSGTNLTSGLSNTFYGFGAGTAMENGTNNVLIGRQAGKENLQGSLNTMLGTYSGYLNEGSGNVLIGYSAGYFELGSNKLYIDNSGSGSPLIYGEFNNDLLRINGTLDINNAYTLPTVDGSENQILKTNGEGTLGWAFAATDTLSLIADADRDTKIQVEENPDEDIIRFDLDSTGYFSMHPGRLDFLNNGNSVFVGFEAGFSDDFSDNRNAGVGHQALKDNTTGRWNSALGYAALRGNTTGESNVAIGFAAQAPVNATGSDNIAIGKYALVFNSSGNRNVAIGSNAAMNLSSGSGNVFIGYDVGKGQNFSNRLMIDNSDTTETLIYGEFDSDLVRINGDLEVTGTIPDVRVLTDTDQDTRVQVEKNADEDIIRFDLGGTESFLFSPARIDVKSSDENVYLGGNAGSIVGAGVQNTVVGSNAFLNNTSGSRNVALGARALIESDSGERNVAIGHWALRANISGQKNVAIGHRAGDANTGSGNVFIGYDAGFAEFGSNKLYIENSNSSAPLVYGDFDTDYLKFNGDVDIAQDLEVTGNAGIGIADPQEKLEVGTDTDVSAIIGRTRVGKISSLNDVAGFSHLDQNSTAGYALLQNASGATSLNSAAGQALELKINNVAEFAVGSDGVINTKGNWISGDGDVEGILITPGGQVGIGAHPSDRALRVRRDYTNDAFIGEFINLGYSDPGSTTNYRGIRIQAGRDVNNNVDSDMLWFSRPDGAVIGAVYQNNANTVAYSTTSDIRLKTNITPTHFAVEDLMNIEVSDYVYRDEPDAPVTGFIAQQLYTVYPNAVQAGGTDPKTDPWMVEYGSLTPLLVKSIQDQQEQIAAQEARILELERALAEMANRNVRK